MNKYGMKVAACAIAGSLSLSGYQTTLESKIHNASDVPAAGVAVVLDESSTIQDLQVEVVQNIAYLESASGLQPNIVLASEKVALAETPTNVMKVNALTANVSTEIVQEISETFEESESEASTVNIEEGTQTDVEHSEEESAQQVTTEQETEKQTELSTEEANSTEETGSAEETSETEESTELGTDDDFQTSAGFSATDTYEDVETEEATEDETETETQEDAQDFSGLVIAKIGRAHV